MRNLPSAGRREKALAATEDAVGVYHRLAEFFVYPADLARWLPAFRRRYIDCCERLGPEPDAGLLAPADEVLARLGLEEEDA